MGLCSVFYMGVFGVCGQWKNPSKKSKAYSMIDYTTQYNFSGGLVFVDNLKKKGEEEKEKQKFTGLLHDLLQPGTILLISDGKSKSI